MIESDVLFVINQNVSLLDIKKQLADVHSAIVLSTHSLFEYEKLYLGPKVVSFFCFVDFLSDKDMSDIDQKVTDELLRLQTSKSVFNSKFMFRTLVLKNQL